MKVFNERINKTMFSVFHCILGNTGGYYLSNPVCVRDEYIVSYVPTEQTLSEWYAFLSEEQERDELLKKAAYRKKVANRCAVCAFIIVFIVSSLLFFVGM